MPTPFKLTERDLVILQFINTFGFCEMPQIDQRFSFKKPRNYQVMNRLIKAGYVKHERVFYAQHGIYRLSQKGSQLTDLPALARVPLANYKHDILLIEVYLRLRLLHPEAHWISARQLMRDKHVDGVGKRGHLPDGILGMAEGKHIAIEVELTLKGKHRLERILKAYSAEFSYQEVWYYCSEGVAASMRHMVEKLPFIKIFLLKDFLGQPFR